MMDRARHLILLHLRNLVNLPQLIDEPLHRNLQLFKVRVVGQTAHKACFEVLLGYLALQVCCGVVDAGMVLFLVVMIIMYAIGILGIKRGQAELAPLVHFGRFNWTPSPRNGSTSFGTG